MDIDQEDTSEDVTIEDQFNADTLDDDTDAETPADDMADDGETEEAEEAPEEDNAEDDDDETAEDGPVVVALPDGSEVSADELVSGYLRQEDYTQKTQKLADERRAAEEQRSTYGEDAKRLEQAYQKFNEFMHGLVPPEPDLSLLDADPQAYQRQQVMRSKAIAELNQLATEANAVKADVSRVTDADKQRARADEDAKLLEAMPQLKEPGRMGAFEKSMQATGSQLGFTAEEISTVADHRLKRLVHYAGLGLKAESNRSNAKRRVASKPQPARTVGKTSAPRDERGRAMARLKQSGSIEDAIAALR